MFDHIKPGDTITRMLAGTVPMKLKVTSVDENYIHCGDWKFDIKTGAEIDEDLGWDSTGTGSYIVKEI